MSGACKLFANQLKPPEHLVKDVRAISLLVRGLELPGLNVRMTETLGPILGGCTRILICRRKLKDGESPASDDGREKWEVLDRKGMAISVAAEDTCFQSLLFLWVQILLADGLVFDGESSTFPVS